MKEKLIRDPVHDVIVLRLDDPGEALLFNLINAREFQRLRRIRQLGLACLTYPGAEHTRYSHSLGVMQTARRILNRLSRQVRIDPYQRIACLAAALLHDLGHGPFSHVLNVSAASITKASLGVSFWISKVKFISYSRLLIPTCRNWSNRCCSAIISPLGCTIS